MACDRLLIRLMLAALAVAAAGLIAGWIARDPLDHFEEGGPLTWYSAAQLLAAAILCRRIRRQRPAAAPGRGLWTMLGLGFVFLALDELFKIHERIDEAAHALLGLRQTELSDQIDDLIVLAYAMVGAALLWRWRAELKRHGALWRYLAAGLVLTLAMVAADIASDSPDLLRRIAAAPARFGAALTVIEETVKLLAEAVLLAGIARAGAARAERISSLASAGAATATAQGKHESSPRSAG